MTYAYSTKVHRAAKLPPFSLVLSQQPTGVATRTERPMPRDVEHVEAVMALQIRLIQFAVRLIRMVDNTYSRHRDNINEITKKGQV